ncbi:MAG: sensor histidine kinase [Rubrivivax sp.]|nr:sensor histidine kinase [Rubrivivax sp.]
MIRRWRRVLALAAALGVTALPWLLDYFGAAPASTLLQTARFGETVDDEAAREQALPHRWHTDCKDCRTVWYRFEITQPELPRDTQALLLPAVGQNAAAYLNGRLLGAGGRFSDPAARLGQRPLLLSAPVSLWQPGHNRLYVLVKSERPRFGFMPAPALAAEATLQPLARWRSLLAVTLPQVLAAAAAMLGLVLGVIWYYRRRETDYAWLAATALAWALHGFSALVLEPPWPMPWWDAWLLATLALVAASLLALARRLATEAPARLAPARHVALVVVMVLAAAATAWEPEGRGLEVARAMTLMACAVAGLQWARAGWRRDDARRFVPGFMLVVVAVAEAAAVLASAPLRPALALPLAMAVMLGMAGWLLLLRFVETLNAVELLNVDLESLVQARTAELQTQFERVRELERHQLIAAERERLMRDMHDGVGGHLVSMLAMLEADHRRPSELATVVRNALDDMRLMIDSLEPVDDDLNAVLAMFHDRLTPRLRAAGVALHWDVQLLPVVPGLTPARVLHVLRILQEAVTNALRHGHARTLWIGAAVAAGGVHIEVRDDGSGFDPQGVASGRGLKNMRRRADEVGATLGVHSSPGRGATVRVVMSLA